MPTSTSPIRRGMTCYLTLDHDAKALLEEMAAGPRSQGRLLSEFIRQEYARREERAKVRQAPSVAWHEARP